MIVIAELVKPYKWELLCDSHMNPVSAFLCRAAFKVLDVHSVQLVGKQCMRRTSADNASMEGAVLDYLCCGRCKLVQNIALWTIPGLPRWVLGSGLRRPGPSPPPCALLGCAAQTQLALQLLLTAQHSLQALSICLLCESLDEP